MRGLSYTDLAFEVISRYVGPDEVPKDKLKNILMRSFETFRTNGKIIILKLNYKSYFFSILSILQ